MEDNAVTAGHKRRNSIPSAVVVPTRQTTPPPILSKGHHYHHRRLTSPPPPFFASADFELVSLKSPPTGSYTSLKDILPWSPSSIMSPTPAAASAAVSTASSGSGYEISIRNRLVKQAAWAYLQPAVSSSPSSSSHLCFSGVYFRPMVAGFRRLVAETATRVYDWLVDALWLILLFSCTEIGLIKWVIGRAWTS